MAMRFTSLQDRINRLGNPALFLRNAPAGAYVYPVQPEHKLAR